jgi:NRPS condensation-like uncharacterized protein
LVNHYPSLKRWFRYNWEYRDGITSRDILQEVDNSATNLCSEEAITLYNHHYVSQGIDISREIPLQVLLIGQSQQTHLIFFVNHAASDAIGLLLFIQSFIQLYEGILCNEKKDTAPSDFKAISLPDSTFRWSHLSWPRLYAYLKHASLLQREQPIQLYPQKKGHAPGRPLTIIRKIPPQQFKILQTTAQLYQGTINDCLLAAMFQTVKKWKQQQGEEAGRIYINVPVSLRASANHTVSNTLSGFNVSLLPSSIRKREDMVRLVQQEMTALMKARIPDTALTLACLFKPVPLRTKMLIFKHFLQTVHPTLTLSNIGMCNLTDSPKDTEGFGTLGSARISSICFISPPSLWPQVGVLTYNNTMMVTLSVANLHFPLGTAERFLDSFIQELTS